MEQVAAFLVNEAEIVEKAKVDEQAFGLLYEFYFPKIYSYVQRRVGSREIAEDLVSQVFLKAFSHRNNYQSRGFCFGAWLYRIATNTLTDYYRRDSHRDETQIEQLQSEPESTDTVKELENISDRAAIEKVLAKMPLRYRQVVHLRYFAEMEISEIAEALNLPKTHASVILHRALHCFKQKAEKNGIKFYQIIF